MSQTVNQTVNQTVQDQGTTVDRVRAYVVREFLGGDEGAQPGLDEDLLNSGIIDSLGLLKVIAWLESEFDIAVDDADLDPENFKDLQAVAAFVDDARPALD